MSRRYTVVRDEFGTSMPTVPLPGTGARMRTFSARIVIATLFDSDEIFSTRTPAAGYNSNSVTVGPFVTSPDSTSMPNSCNVSRNTFALAFKSSITSRLPGNGGCSSKSSVGNRYSSPEAALTLPSTVAAGGRLVAFRLGRRRSARPLPHSVWNCGLFLLWLELLGDLLDQRRRVFTAAFFLSAPPWGRGTV